jgi:hypothetical protein
LDKLVAGGLLDADFETPGGLRRRVGRAPKRYRPSPLEVSLSLPERRYDLVGEILVDALRQASAAQTQLDTARRVAFARGRQIGAARHEQLHTGRLGAERTMVEVRSLLDGLGFEPAEDPDGSTLRTCAFRAVAHRDPDLVCGLNAGFVDGILRGLGNTTVSADLRPEKGLCCVRLRPPGSSLATTDGI